MGDYLECLPEPRAPGPGRPWKGEWDVDMVGDGEASQSLCQGAASALFGALLTVRHATPSGQERRELLAAFHLGPVPAAPRVGPLPAPFCQP